MSFAMWLRQQMDNQGWSVTEFARQLGINHGTVSLWLSGQRSPNAKSVRRVAAVLRVDEDVALTLAGHKSPDPYLEPEGPEAQLMPLIRDIDWAYGDRLEKMKHELRFMIDWDQERREKNR